MGGGRVPKPRGQLDAQRAHNMSHSALYTVTRAPAMRLPVISIHQKKSRERYLSLSAIATVGARVWRQIKKKQGERLYKPRPVQRIVTSAPSSINIGPSLVLV